MWAQLNREGIRVARCTVERLMRELGLRGSGARQARKAPRSVTSASGPRSGGSELPAPAPNRLWVADLTYVGPAPGSSTSRSSPSLLADDRRLAGIEVVTHRPGTRRARSKRSGRANKAAPTSRARPSQRQGRAISRDSLHRAPGRNEIVNSVGSKGDSYDNALAESDHRALQDRTRPTRPLAGLDDLEHATLE